MRPEEWRHAMENEAASVGDVRWARETRRAAGHGWRLNPWGEVRALMVWCVALIALTATLWAVLDRQAQRVVALGAPEHIHTSAWKVGVVSDSARTIVLAWNIWQGLIALGGCWLALRGHVLLTALGGYALLFVLPTLLIVLTVPQEVGTWITAAPENSRRAAEFLFIPLLFIAGGWIGGHLLSRGWQKVKP